MTVKEKLEKLHDKIKSFEYIPKDIDNGLLAFLNNDIQELRNLIVNATEYDQTLNKRNSELYLRELDRPLAILYRFGSKSTPEERLKALPGIKSSVDNGVDIFLLACNAVQSQILLQEISQIPDVSYPYFIRSDLDTSSSQL